MLVHFILWKRESRFLKKPMYSGQLKEMFAATLSSQILVLFRRGNASAFLLSASYPSTTVNEEVTLTFFTFFLYPGVVISSKVLKVRLACIVPAHASTDPE